MLLVTFVYLSFGKRKKVFLSFLQNFLFSIFSEVSLGHVDAQSYNSKRQREEKKEFLLLEKKVLQTFRIIERNILVEADK